MEKWHALLAQHPTQENLLAFKENGLRTMGLAPADFDQREERPEEVGT